MCLHKIVYDNFVVSLFVFLERKGVRDVIGSSGRTLIFTKVTTLKLVLKELQTLCMKIRGNGLVREGL